MQKEMLTMAKALKIQAEHLAQWEQVLKPEVFARVKAIVEEKNRAAYPGPYDVFRGTKILELIVNAAYYGLVDGKPSNTGTYTLVPNP
jgi:hypothetical protein